MATNQFYKYNQEYNGYHPDTVYSSSTNNPIKNVDEYKALGGNGSFSDVDVRDLPSNNLTTPYQNNINNQASSMRSDISAGFDQSINKINGMRNDLDGSQKSMYQSALEAAMNAYKPTAEYTDTLRDISDLKRGYQQSDLNLRDNSQNPVPMNILRGQQAIAQEQYNLRAETLQDKLSRLQTERQFGIDAAKLGLSAYSPQEVGVGGSLLQRNSTGTYDTVGQGQSYADKIAYQSTNSVLNGSPDAAYQWDPNLSAQENLEAARYAASQSQSFANKQQSYGASRNPLTGELNLYNTKQGYDPGAVTAPTTNLGSGALPFYKSSDVNDKQVYNSAGIPISYEQYIAQGGNGKFTDVEVRGAAPKKSTLGSSRGSGTSGGYSTDPTKVVALETAKGVGSAIAESLAIGAKQATAYNTLVKNSQLLQQTMAKYKINESQYPDLNALNNAFKARGADAGVIASYKNSLNTLRAEYQQFLSRNGTPTDQAKKEANESLPANLTPAQLARVLEVIKQEGFNSIQSQQDTIGMLQNYGNTIPLGKANSSTPAPNLLQGSGALLQGSGASSKLFDLKF